MVGLNVEWTASLVALTTVHALGVHLKRDNDLAAIITGSARGLPPPHHDGEVVVYEILWVASICIIVLGAQFETTRVVFLGSVNSHKGRCAGQIVQNPFSHIAIVDQVSGPLDILSADHTIAEVMTLVVLSHIDLEIRVLDPITTQDFSQVLCHRMAAGIFGAGVLLACRWANERQVKVRILKLTIIGVDLVDKQRYVFVVLVALN